MTFKEFRAIVPDNYCECGCGIKRHIKDYPEETHSSDAKLIKQSIGLCYGVTGCVPGLTVCHSKPCTGYAPNLETMILLERLEDE